MAPDAVVEWRVRGARCKRAFERVERGQERKQGVTPALVTRPFMLPRHSAPKVLEVRQQSKTPVLLFAEAAPELVHVVAGGTVAVTLGLHGSSLPWCRWDHATAATALHEAASMWLQESQNGERREERGCQVVNLENDDLPAQRQ